MRKIVMWIIVVLAGLYLFGLAAHVVFGAETGTITLELYVKPPQGEVVKTEVEKDPEEMYWNIVENTAAIREMAEENIHKECRSKYEVNPDQEAVLNLFGMSSGNRSSEIYCILSQSYAMKRVTSAMQGLADVLWYGSLEEGKQALEDFQFLDALLDNHDDWIEIDLKYTQYLEASKIE